MIAASTWRATGNNQCKAGWLMLKIETEAPSIPAINDKMVYCTGARKHGDDRYIILDGEEYSQIHFVDGTIKLYWH